MAKEVVITSVPRGIKLGRTGFQVVMRTAGTADGVLSTLEQLAGYRHVFPQGSGKNPLIYTYRQVRGPTGQLNVLGRTTDAGNDFSNRSNKLAHLLAIDSGELSVLRSSSPAAVLAAIEGRLSQVWQGGPEERPQPFALPVPPAQAGVCKRWNDVKGDSGWGGLVAQRALRGQPSLVIAPDCSPTWSRRLLDLFQEVLALLPPDGRWKTTFETTVIGSSTSLLRGTYAGSPESAAGHAGLLVVDLSQRGPLPANVAVDEMITIARQGPKQAAAGRAPPLSGMGNAPMLPGTAIEGAAVTAGGLRPAGPVGPSRAPVASFDDDETPRSKVGWYIGLATVLLGAVLVGGSVGVWFWLDGRTTQELQIRFNAYADIADEKMPSGKQGVDAPPGLQNWKRLFRDDKDSSNVSDAAFPILLSALRTERVDATTIQDRERRRELVAAANALADIKGDPAKLLDHASVLGLTIPENLDDKKTAVTMFLASWLRQDGDKSGAATPLDDFDGLQTKINLAGEFIEAVFATAGDPGREKQLEALVKDIWPGAVTSKTPENWIKSFTTTLDQAKPDLEADFSTLLGLLNTAVTPPKIDDASAPAQAKPDGSGDPVALERKAFSELRRKLRDYVRGSPADSDEIPLATEIDVANLRLTVDLPSCGTWKPEAVPDNEKQPTCWELKGLPNDANESKTLWGKLLLDRNKRTLVFKSDLRSKSNHSHDCFYVPIRFSTHDSRENCPPVVIAAQEKTHFRTDVPQSLCRLMESGELELKPEDSVSVSQQLISQGGSLVVSVSKTCFGMDLHRRNPDSPRFTVDITGAKPKSLKTRLQDIWLASFEFSEIQGDSLAFRVTCQAPNPTTMEQRKRSELSSTAKPYKKDKWEKLVRDILEASRIPQLQGPLNAKAKPFVELWLGGPPRDKTDRENLVEITNRCEAEGIGSWQREAESYLFDEKNDYYAYTSGLVKRDLQMERPNETREPRRPPEKAPPAELDEYKRNHDKWKQNDDRLKKWQTALNRLLFSSQNIRQFVNEDTDSHSDEFDACRAAAIVVLEAAAQNFMKTELDLNTVDVPSLFSIEIFLNWKFHDARPGDARPERVPRLIIERAPPKTEPASPPQSARQSTDVETPTR